MSNTSSLIQTQNLIKAYGLNVVLRKIDLSVSRGEFVALLGPNGGGKSTLLRLLAALGKPTAGKITIGGWTLPAEAPAVHAQIGMVGHKPLLYENLNARENLRFFARLHNLPPAETDTRIAQLLERVGLAKRTHDLVRTFSRGMQQRLSIARALLHNPDVLLFDEPHTGLDQDASLVLDDLLTSAHASGHTVIMTTHDLERAARLSSRVLILSRGSLVYDQPASAQDAAALAAHYADLTGIATTR